GSEIGESITRSVPNSSTRPASTLNGVPASATSSPITKMVGSRRISSRKASLTACASVSSRVPTASSVDMVRHLARVGEGRVQRVLDRVRDLGLDALAHAFELSFVAEPRREERERATLRRPLLLLGFGAVVGAVDVADVVAVVAVGAALEEAGPLAAP